MPWPACNSSASRASRHDRGNPKTSTLIAWKDYVCVLVWGYVFMSFEVMSRLRLIRFLLLLFVIRQNHAHIELECNGVSCIFSVGFFLRFRFIRARDWDLDCSARQTMGSVCFKLRHVNWLSTQIVYRLQMDSEFLTSKWCQINLTPCHHVFLEGLFSALSKTKTNEKESRTWQISDLGNMRHFQRLLRPLVAFATNFPPNEMACLPSRILIIRFIFHNMTRPPPLCAACMISNRTHELSSTKILN